MPLERSRFGFRERSSRESLSGLVAGVVICHSELVVRRENILR
jgi:hypothetical protein